MSQEALNIPSVQHLVSPEEWQLRRDLAACYRLVAQYGWSDLVFTHISARLPGPEHHFLINPYGLMFDEITASSLVKVDMGCNKLMDSPFPSTRGLRHPQRRARGTLRCAMRDTHPHARRCGRGGAEKGLLPISQQSTFVLGSLAYHGYEGVAFREDEKPRLVADMGEANFLMLRNHGLLTCGATIADAFLSMYVFESACQIQIAAQSGGGELTEVNPQILQGVAHAMKVQTDGLGGRFVWPALLRKLDRIDPGYRN